MPTVLAVDDEEAILRAIQRTLRREPYNLVLANDYAEALEKLTALRPEVLLTDFRMPGGSGADLAEFAKKQDPKICCILLSGCSDEESGRRLVSAPGVDLVILKPWRNEELRDVLRAALEYAE